MQGQGSLGVNEYTSENNEQLSQQLDPQEVGSLAKKTHPGQKETWEITGANTYKKVRNDVSRRTTSHCERKGRIRQNRLERNVVHKWWGCGRWIGDFIASCREYTLSRTHLTRTQRLVMFLMSMLSVITKFMESTFGSHQHLETKPKFGWSYPEAQIVTWMSCDTENQKISLKKLLTNVCKIRRKSIPKMKGQKPIFLFIKKVSEYLFANEFSYGYKWEIQVSTFLNKLVSIRDKGRQMAQFIGNS